MRVNNFVIIPFLIISFQLFIGISLAEAQNTDSEIQILKEEIRRLNQRVDDLEKQRAEEKKMAEQSEGEQEKAQEQLSASLGSYVDQRIQKFGLFNTSRTLFTGYGAAGFNDVDGKPSTFSAVFAMIFHYQLSDKLHIIIEPEFCFRQGHLAV